ncbi:MAG: ABC-type sugar transport system, ATPase component [Armatimonadetes bacterium]|nr:ABC-type sugar transport system, ATPase component [Armatimonadota bacterium]
MSETSQTPLLEMTGISKFYPGVVALNDVHFDVLPGEVHALCGENGAGKSTLMKILAGAESKDRGDIRINGKPVSIHSPQDAMALGVNIIYQEFNLVPHLSAAENIYLGREPAAAVPGFINFRKLYGDAQSVMDSLGVSVDVRAEVSRLSVAQQQMVEIAKATSRNSIIIAMDEPSATLTDHELRNLFELIRQLKTRGVGIVYISHRMEEIFDICDRVTVFRDGQYVATKRIEDTSRDEVIRMMVGRELKESIPKRPAEVGEPMLEVRGLTRKGVFHDISFTVRRGEIVGIGGLVGAGRTEVARAIFGADPIDAGEIRVLGKPVRPRSPREAIELGIGLVPEDRKSLGLILNMVVRENTTLANLDLLSMLGFVNRKKEREVAEKYVKDLRVRTPSIEQEVRNLSGGNQQKVVLAKWLFTDSKLLIFDEPPRGIDVGAKIEIYELMNELVARGAGMIMISSELPELLGMSDRILVMHEGRLAGELSRAEATQEKVMQLATGGE